MFCSFEYLLFDYREFSTILQKFFLICLNSSWFNASVALDNVHYLWAFTKAIYAFNGTQLAKMKKYTPNMSLP